MAGIIKATGRQTEHLIGAAAFNFDDVSSKAQGLLDEIRQQATQMVAKAQAEADQIRRKAHEDGYRTGLAAAQKSANDSAATTLQQQITQHVSQARPIIEQTIAGISRAKQEWLSHWEAEAVGLATGIAQRVIRRELSHKPEITTAFVREALELAAGSQRVKLHLNPTDFNVLREQVEQLASHINKLATTEVVADPAISPGGCQVTTEYGMIDQQIETQLKRIEEELAS